MAQSLRTSAAVLALFFLKRRQILPIEQQRAGFETSDQKTGASIFTKNDMSKRSLLITKLFGSLLALFGVTTGNALAAGYLTKTGPITLRFHAVPPQNPSILSPLPIVRSAPKKPANASITPRPPFKPMLSLIPDGFLLNGLPPLAILNGTGSAPTSPTKFTAQPETADPPPEVPAANDPVVTPQMLVDYFKPIRSPDGGASVSVQVPLNFTPPIPASASSSATYRSQ